MIGALLHSLPVAWSVARIAAPGTTSKIIRAMTLAAEQPHEDRLLAENLNAYANMATAYQSYKALAERSNDPAVISARKRLAEVMKQEQAGREAMIQRKIAEGAERT